MSMYSMFGEGREEGDKEVEIEERKAFENKHSYAFHITPKVTQGGSKS